jgi:PAS domain S-box-containing protein
VALLLTGFFVALMIAVIVQKSVSDPISHLTQVVNNVRETGDLTYRFTAHKNDEIGVLSAGLSNMLQEINHLHSQLEERVKERTFELEQQRNRFKNLTVNLPAMIYQAISDPSGNTDFTYVSPNLREFYEISDDEMEDLNKTLFSRVHPEDQETLERSNREAIVNVTPWHGFHRIIVPSGKMYWVEGASNPVQQADGSVLWDGLLLDITARKMGEQKLMLSEARLEEAQRIANVGNWEWSFADEILFCSKEAYRIFGLDPDSGTVSYAALLKIVHPDDRQAVTEIIEEARSKPGDYNIEHRFIMPDSSIKYVAENVRTEFDANGAAVRMIGTVQDISERYLVQQELKKSHDDLAAANEQLRNADRIKSIFLASMSHELRTPLNSIIGFTSIMLQGMVGDISEEQKKQLGMVKKSADHLLELINDVLDISKIEAGQIELNLETFALEEVVGEVVGNLMSLADKKGIELIYTSKAPIDIYADKRRIKQIVFNLAGNGIKFTLEGKVTVATRPVGKDMFEIKVSDTGIGIREDSLFRLFQPFQQVDDSLTKKYEGTGLGLYLSKKLANLLGGDISVESVYGEGSTFTVTIPRVHEGKGEQ